ncbi:MAG: bifunctional methylenetetrahydrofolate dehydrogenase/methenyltetrahydrofolate cyclohydrolase FolD [Oligoflexia bacterium]|nr:bifunctional methylenetetrahydrofolate dehydrogenase/methenyltetrahydrofolate cyclohydrolase FolD [Oligoflexia bacterium]
MLTIDGRPVAESVLVEVAKDVKKFTDNYGRPPHLAVVNVGDDPASAIYLRNKEKACAQVGMQSTRHSLDKERSQEELDALITKLNSDGDVHGILVQLPMPKHFSVDAVLDSMNPLKDSDGFHPENLGLLMSGRPRVKPCTPYGVMKMLQHYDISVSGQNVVVIGRSNIVGKPMAQLLTAANATVTLCHSKTKDIKKFTKEAHVVVVAAGQPKMFDASYFGPNTFVIDVGMHHIDGKICGDVDFDSCKGKVKGISPVPGGVGKMTVAMLLRNTIDLALIQEARRKL